MTTPSDVVSELVRLTESGELEWEPNLFDDAGLPTHWHNARRGTVSSMPLQTDPK